MIRITISEEVLHAVKKVLEEEVQGARSSHLFEAVSRSLGFKSYNSLRSVMKSIKEAETALFDCMIFAARIRELSGELPLVIPADLDSRILSHEIPRVVEVVD